MFRSTRQVEREDQWAAFEGEAIPYLDYLFRLAMWLTRNHTEAEDIVQETFTEALKSFHRYEQGTNCRAWLVTIMYHLNSKRLRAGSRLRLVNDSEGRISSTAVYTLPTPQGITDEDILNALRALPVQFREVVILSDVEEMAYKEISAALGVPIGTVMSRLHRGRKLLRAQLAACANEHGIGRVRAGASGQALPVAG
ncbi:MAG TPA: sigma-70 family RNA polymerase sigma factor [Pyrinomonadaceae bacterium]|nr:sigma-70 family RNA polymerase sigma factor [Pyrinomonadaceae bacterium]